MINLLPYFRLKKTQEDKDFFFAHSGFFNFWDELLIVRNKSYSPFGFAGCVLVDRGDRKFTGVEMTVNEKIMYGTIIDNSIRTRKPEEMFVDFPELLESETGQLYGKS